MADTRRAEKPQRPIQNFPWECRLCEAETGVASNATSKIRKGGHISLKTGKMTGGTFFDVCAMCLARGRTLIVCEA